MNEEFIRKRSKKVTDSAQMSVPGSVCWKMSMLGKIKKIKNIIQFQRISIQFIIMRNIKITQNLKNGKMHIKSLS